MGEMPEPFVRTDLDLRDFRWMKLDLIALFNSDFNATPDDTAWRAGVTLWGKAWHQVPAGSLPDDDARLCNLAGLGRDVRTWKRIREQALHGFVRCSDGRLYHTFLCDMAMEAAAERDRYTKRREADRVRKGGRNSDGIPSEPTLPEPPVPTEFPTEIPIEGQGQGEGDNKIDANASIIPSKRGLTDRELQREFEGIWPRYPRRVDKGDALKAYRKARKAVSREDIQAGVERYAAERRGEDPQFTKHFSTWLNAQCWADEATPNTIEIPARLPPKPINPKILGHGSECMCSNCERWTNQMNEAAE